MNTNTEREELALDIFLADNSSISEGSLRQDWAAEPETHRPYAHNIADGLIAKGYRKPRTITTTEGLDALPNGSAVLDGSGDVGQKLSGLWHFPETAPIKSSKVAKYGAATVLYTPEPTR